jgi:hypothetical protein
MVLKYVVLKQHLVYIVRTKLSSSTLPKRLVIPLCLNPPSFGLTIPTAANFVNYVEKSFLDLKPMACCCSRYTVLHLTLLIPDLVDDNFDNYVLNFKCLINASAEMHH